MDITRIGLSSAQVSPARPPTLSTTTAMRRRCVRQLRMTAGQRHGVFSAFAGFLKRFRRVNHCRFICGYPCSLCGYSRGFVGAFATPVAPLAGFTRLAKLVSNTRHTNSSKSIPDWRAAMGTKL